MCRKRNNEGSRILRGLDGDGTRSVPATISGGLPKALQRELAGALAASSPRHIPMPAGTSRRSVDEEGTRHRPLLGASVPRARRQLLAGGVSRFGGEPVAKHSPAEGLCLSVRACGHVPDVISSAVDRVAEPRLVKITFFERQSIGFFAAFLYGCSLLRLYL